MKQSTLSRFFCGKASSRKRSRADAEVIVLDAEEAPKKENRAPPEGEKCGVLSKRSKSGDEKLLDPVESVSAIDFDAILAGHAPSLEARTVFQAAAESSAKAMAESGNAGRGSGVGFGFGNEETGAKFVSRLAQEAEDAAAAGLRSPKMTKNDLMAGEQLLTPLEEQVASIRGRHRHLGVVLAIQIGYKFRFFGRDAVSVSRVSRIWHYIDRNYVVASVPTVTLMKHVQRLVNAGHKVGIVRQSETAALKAAGKTSGKKSGTFKRALCEVYSYATLPPIEDETTTAVGEEESAEEDVEADVDGSEKEDTSSKTQAQPPLQDGNHSEMVEKWIVALYEATSEKGGTHVSFGMAAIDPKSGRVVFDSFSEETSNSSRFRLALETRMRQLQPAELVLPDRGISGGTENVVRSALLNSKCRMERVPVRTFSLQEDLVKGFSNVARVVKLALCGLHRHLQQYGLADLLLGTEAKPLVGSDQSCMLLDGQTIRDLELLRTAQGQKGSLFWLLDKTETSLGRRALREWIRKPLLDLNKIHSRQNAVEEMKATLEGDSADAHVAKLRVLLAELKRAPDLANLLTQLRTNVLTPRRMLLLLDSIDRMLSHIENLDLLTDDIQHRLVALHKAARSIPRNGKRRVESVLETINREAIEDTEKHLNAALEEACPVSADIVESFPGLVRAIKSVEEAENKLGLELKSVRERLGKPGLEWKTVRTGPTSCLEYMVELNKAEATRIVPNDWIVVSQTKSVIRYHTRSTPALHQQLLEAREEFEIAKDQAWRGHCKSVCEMLCGLPSDSGTTTTEIEGNNVSVLPALVDFVGMIDAIAALARVASLPGYVRPRFTDVDDSGPRRVKIRNARHPILEHFVSDYVANDVELKSADGTDSSSATSLLVTGPNMGGKSSYVRSIALISVMAQIGSFVPADEANVCLFDSILTRMGADDDLASGLSTFLMELTTTNRIIRNASKRSLVILDELGRGTSTHDGCALALATLRYVACKLRPICLFVTHYPQIAKSDIPGLETCHMGFLGSNSTDDDCPPAGSMDDNEITLLYKVEAGVATRSYGIHTAGLAGMPCEVLKEAAKKAADARTWFDSKASQER